MHSSSSLARTDSTERALRLCLRKLRFDASCKTIINDVTSTFRRSADCRVCRLVRCGHDRTSAVRGVVGDGRCEAVDGRRLVKEARRLLLRSSPYYKRGVCVILILNLKTCVSHIFMGQAVLTLVAFLIFSGFCPRI